MLDVGSSNFYQTILAKKIGKVDSLLDVGCSICSSLEQLKEINPKAQLEGCDIDLANYEGSIPVKQGDITGKLPYKDKSFDYVLASAILIIIDDDDIEHALKEMARIARKGIIFMEMQDDTLSDTFLMSRYRIRNYESLLKRIFGEKVSVSIEKLWDDKSEEMIKELHLESRAKWPSISKQHLAHIIRMKVK